MGNRTAEQIRRHYEIEKELADRLRNSPAEERRKLYPVVYRELFDRVPDHPMLNSNEDPESGRTRTQSELKLLSPFLKPDINFLEIGPGDCRLAFEICERVSQVHAVDVSGTLISHQSIPKNFKFVLSDGIHLDFHSESMDFVYSNQLMEHLHPDDALEQVAEVYRVLKPGGKYFCITPHRFMGPEDISKYFDKVATGFHLKEYTNTELYSIFKKIGFSPIRSYIGWRAGHYRKVPVFPSMLTELLFRPLPHFIRKKLAFAPVIRNLLYIKILATKPE
jgi:ubiquinone/menaquinone biosynthesis C-methylase UbiE